MLAARESRRATCRYYSETNKQYFKHIIDHQHLSNKTLARVPRQQVGNLKEKKYENISWRVFAELNALDAISSRQYTSVLCCALLMRQKGTRGGGKGAQHRTKVYHLCCSFLPYLIYILLLLPFFPLTVTLSRILELNCSYF